MVGVHLVDEADLHLVADAEPPVDRGVLSTCLAVDELPSHVRGSGHPVHLDHVVLPLDALCGVVSVLMGVIVVLHVVLVMCVLRCARGRPRR